MGVLRPGVIAIVRDEAERVLLMRRADDGEWSVPAGGIEPGESPADAVVREVQEETGLVVVPVAVAAVHGPIHRTYPNGDIVEYTAVIFHCVPSGGVLETVDGEALELGWFGPDNLPEIRGPYASFLLSVPPGTATLFVPPRPR